MASTFKSLAIGVPAAQTLFYTAPALTSSVVFSGTVSNKDTATKAQYTFTLERKVGGTYTSVLTQIPIQFGQSLTLPKMVLQAGEMLYITASTVSVLDIDISVLERT